MNTLHTWIQRNHLRRIVNKLENLDFVDYIKHFDICAFVEAWLTQEDILRRTFHGYSTLFIPAFKYERKGRPMCGISVIIKDTLKDEVTAIYMNSKFMVGIKINKHVLSTLKDVLLCIVYLPPRSANAFSREDARGINSIEQKLDNSDIDISDVHLVISGDLNARIGTKSEMYTQERFPVDFDDGFDIENLPLEERMSCDKIVNGEGEFLIQLCTELSLIIANGRYGEGKGVGHFTYTSTKRQ